MEYLIGEVSKIFNLPISTLRYYENEGLLDVKRNSGIRKYEEKDLSTLKIIECLKSSGLKIEEIKRYMDLAKKGDSTIEERYQLFLEAEKRVKKQMDDLNKTMMIIEYKKWFYETAIKDGTCENVSNAKLEDLPKNIQKLYKEAHYSEEEKRGN